MTLQRKKGNTIYEGFGFPVELKGVPMVLVQGVWAPDVDMHQLSNTLLLVLAAKPARLTGNEIRFVRLSWGMTLEEFAERFAVTHPAVLKWEKAGDESPNMSWTTEKDMRLELLRRGNVKPSEFVVAYGELAASKPARARSPTRLDFGSKRGKSKRSWHRDGGGPKARQA